MIVNKNDLTKLARVLVTYLGYMSIAFGLALPAYGQVESLPPCVSGDAATATTGITDDDSGNPKSFAAGCGSKAGTDGSYANGVDTRVLPYPGVEKATTLEREDQVVLSDGGVTETHSVKYWVYESGNIEKYYLSKADRTAGKGSRGETPEQLRERLLMENEPTTAGSFTYNISNVGDAKTVENPTDGYGGTGVGNKITVVGARSTAIGYGAKIGMETRTVTDPGTDVPGVEVGRSMVSLERHPTHEAEVLYYVIERDGKTYYYTDETARDADIDKLKGLGKTATVASINTTTLTGKLRVTLKNDLLSDFTTAQLAVSPPGFVTAQQGNLEAVQYAAVPRVILPVAAENAVAIGGSATVTGGSHNGIAIGADSKVNGQNGTAIGQGAMAGTNSVSLGQGVTADANQIRIGRTGMALVEIGGYNIGSMSSTINIMGGAVRNNSTDIATNSTDIATNSTDIATNSAGIAMSIAFAHLPSVSAGDKGSWGIGAGSFAGKTALAVGISYRVQTNGVIKAGVSSSGGETSFGVGFGKGF